MRGDLGRHGGKQAAQSFGRIAGWLAGHARRIGRAAPGDRRVAGRCAQAQGLVGRRCRQFAAHPPGLSRSHRRGAFERSARRGLRARLRAHLCRISRPRRQRDRAPLQGRSRRVGPQDGTRLSAAAVGRPFPWPHPDPGFDRTGALHLRCLAFHGVARSFDGRAGAAAAGRDQECRDTARGTGEARGDDGRRASQAGRVRQARGTRGADSLGRGGRSAATCAYANTCT